MLDEFTEGLKQAKEDLDKLGKKGVLGKLQSFTGEKRAVKEEALSIATGHLAYPYIKRMAEEIMEAFPEKVIYVYDIRNDFFGEMITVSGLLTGQDIIAQLKGHPLGKRLLLPQNMLRSGEEVFLDDITLSDMEKTLQVKIDIVKSSGYDFVNCVLGLK